MNTSRCVLRNSLCLPVALLAFLFLAPSSRAADGPQYLQRSDTTEPAAQDFAAFGEDVDVDGGLMIVAAPGAGAAYVFALRDGAWQEVAKLARAGVYADEFGANVAIDGNLVAVSAPAALVGAVPGAGAVFVFERGANDSEWTEIARLVAADPSAEANLGEDIELDGQRLVASADSASGEAYLFARDAASGAWGQVHLPPDVIEETSRAAVEVSGDTLLRYAWPYTILVHEFDGTTWSLRQRLTLESAPADIALEGDVMAFALPGGSVDESMRGEGIALVYERGVTGWVQTALLHAPVPYPTSRFGNGMDLRDGLIAIEERPEESPVHVFGKDEGGEWTRLAQAVGTSARGYDYSTAVSAGTVAIGMPGFSMVKVYTLSDVMLPPGSDSGAEGEGDEDSGITGFGITAGESDGDVEDLADSSDGEDADDTFGDVDAIEDDSDAGSIIDTTDNDGLDVDAIEDDSDAGNIIDTVGEDTVADDGGSGDEDVGGTASGNSVNVALPDRSVEDSGGGSVGWLFGLLVAVGFLFRHREIL